MLTLEAKRRANLIDEILPANLSPPEQTHTLWQRQDAAASNAAAPVTDPSSNAAAGSSNAAQAGVAVVTAAAGASAVAGDTTIPTAASSSTSSALPKYISYSSKGLFANDLTTPNWVIGVVGATVVLISLLLLPSRINGWRGPNSAKGWWLAKPVKDPDQLKRRSSEKRGLLNNLPNRLKIVYSESFFNIVDYPIRFTYLSVGQFCLILLMLGGLILAWVRGGGFGGTSLGLLPCIFAFASKSSIMGGFLGKGYEKLNWVHRTLGRLFFLGITIHGASYAVVWVNKGGGIAHALEIDKDNKWGVIGYIGSLLIVVFSIHPIRSRVYKIFRFTHWLGFLLLFVGTWLHVPVKQSQPYVIAAIVFFVFDIIVRRIRTRTTRGFVRPLPGGFTQITVPSIRTGWRAGQHVWVRILDSSLGTTRGMFEPHPFTIASAPAWREGSEGAIRLMISSSGDFTRHLRKCADKMVLRERDESGDQFLAEAEVEVVVEGPYGGPSLFDPNYYSTCVLIAGGSGASFIIALAEEILERSRDKTSHVRALEIIWTAKTAETFIAFEHHFTFLLELSKSTNVDVIMSLHQTQGSIDEKDHPIPGCELFNTRPDLHKIIQRSVDESIIHRATQGVAIATCGPPELIKAASKAVLAVPGPDRRKVGGVVVHSETFGW